jgi:hypothetical protein
VKKTLLIVVMALAVTLGSVACEESSGHSVQGAIRRYFPEQYEKAVRVATCESGLDPRAVSPGGGNHGLFQINTVHRSRVASMGYSWSDIYDPYVNARVARTIYNERGWAPWPVCGRR